MRIGYLDRRMIKTHHCDTCRAQETHIRVEARAEAEAWRDFGFTSFSAQGIGGGKGQEAKGWPHNRQGKKGHLKA
jgi:hypothetical protein